MARARWSNSALVRRTSSVSPSSRNAYASWSAWWSALQRRTSTKVEYAEENPEKGVVINNLEEES
ncbi:MAG: hypothetical protein NVS3B14_00010 [Ktedonobacteraceae bacterium]